MNASLERQRVFRALRGERLPVVGEKAWWSGPDRQLRYLGRHRAKVVVVRVSATGKTIWTRFATESARRKFGQGLHRWWRLGSNGQIVAYSSANVVLFGVSPFTPLERAEALYVKAVCRQELDAVARAEDLVAKAWDASRKTRARMLAVAQEKLAAAETQAREVFRAVVNGELAP